MRAMLLIGMLAAAGAVQGKRLELVGEAERFLPGKVSRDFHEVLASRHPKVPLVVFGCDDCPLTDGTDVHLVKQRGGEWSDPGSVSVSRTHDESLPTFSSDGHWLYYVSDRRGGFGGLDLYRSLFVSYRGSFGSPENVGGGINSAGDEGAASANPEGTTVYFASRGRKDAKGWDLYVSHRRKGRMSPGERLPSIDTRDDEFDPALLANDAGLVFARAKRLGESRSTLWFAPREGEGFGKAVELGAAVNKPGASVRGPQQDWPDPEWLFFSRDGDIWRIRYRVVD